MDMTLKDQLFTNFADVSGTVVLPQSDKGLTYENTSRLEKQIKSFGYSFVSVWKCENPELSRKNLKKKFIKSIH